MLAVGLPWSPFAILLLSRSVRQGWNPDGRPWLIGLAAESRWRALVVGTLVPGLSQAARVVALAGLLVGTAACLECGVDSRPRPACPVARSSSLFGGVLGLWLVVMLYGSYVWNLVDAVLPAAGYRHGHHDHRRRRPGLVGSRDWQYPTRAGRL